MESPSKSQELVEPQPPVPSKAKPPEKPIRKRNQLKVPPHIQTRTPKPTPTAILCELTRLKAQQKYLECNQVKLNPNNFILDDEEDNKAVEPNSEDELDVPDEHPQSGKNQRPISSSTAALISLINEIEQEKLDLNQKFQEYRSTKRGELQDMWHYVAAIKEDVFRPERLSQYTVNALRQRIICVNSQLERLTAKNSKELETLKEEYEKLEKENKFLWKGNM
ncbi:uncharacterized protein [Drosophila kikkawai]|uniref:Uncharacterized protein n=1 Tax=Drosophila kikkawai TaxID=30033 RepID=A0A6P4JEL4_DROKI|nr:uncharacterized protein LOC108082472 [Drosophila kikkawai]